MKGEASQISNLWKRAKEYAVTGAAITIFAGGWVAHHYLNKPEFYGNIKLNPAGVYDVVGRQGLFPKPVEYVTGLIHWGENFYPFIQQPDGSFKPLSEIEEGEWNEYHNAFRQQEIETQAKQKARLESYKERWLREYELRKKVSRRNDPPKNGSMKDFRKILS